MKRLLTLLCATGVAACASHVPASTGASGPSAEAQRVLAGAHGSADLIGALAELDGIADDCRGFAPYHAARGELLSKLAAQSRDAGTGDAGFLFLDALHELTKAVELDSAPTAPRLLLAQALYDANQLEDAVAVAGALLVDLQARNDVEAATIAAAHALRAVAGARAYVAKKAESVDDPELLSSARASFRTLEHHGSLDATLLSLWSTMEQRAGSPDEALKVYVRAAARQPGDHAILNALVETAAAQKQLPLALEALQGRRDATGLWFQGRVRYLMADIERESRRIPAALAALDTAMQCFTASLQQNPAFRDTCEQWLAMCLGKKGNLAFLSDDLPNAEAWLLASTRLRPDCIAQDLGGSETTKLGLLRLGDRTMRDFERTEAFFRAASAAAPTDLDLLNNAAVYARDHGTRLERAGKLEEAAVLYERSYATYQRAVELDPLSVRLRNDCALIAIHHLDRDWDASKQLLDAAIRDGEKALLEDPPTEPRELQDLDEAVGDCYENLALWHLEHSQDAAAAKAAAVRSMEHFPRERRSGARRHLQAAEGRVPD